MDSTNLGRIFKYILKTIPLNPLRSNEPNLTSPRDFEYISNISFPSFIDTGIFILGVQDMSMPFLNEHKMIDKYQIHIDDSYIDRYKDSYRQMDGQIDRWTDRQMDIQIDGQIDKQRDIDS